MVGNFARTRVFKPQIIKTISFFTISLCWMIKRKSTTVVLIFLWIRSLFIFKLDGQILTLLSFYLWAHHEFKFLKSNVFPRCAFKWNVVSPKTPVLFISCLATVELFPQKKEDLFIYIYIYLFALPGISVWNTLFHINTLLRDRLGVWCISSNKPCELLFERLCVWTRGTEETN